MLFERVRSFKTVWYGTVTKERFFGTVPYRLERPFRREGTYGTVPKNRSFETVRYWAVLDHSFGTVRYGTVPTECFFQRSRTSPMERPFGMERPFLWGGTGPFQKTVLWNSPAHHTSHTLPSRLDSTRTIHSPADRADSTNS